jgi:hypothetical protein
VRFQLIHLLSVRRGETRQDDELDLLGWRQLP